jgi:hypothetical protein
MLPSSANDYKKNKSDKGLDKHTEFCAVARQRQASLLVEQSKNAIIAWQLTGDNDKNKKSGS